MSIAPFPPARVSPFLAKGRFNTFDSVYFSIQTLMTIGYGDVLPPAEDLRFTTFYVILGCGSYSKHTLYRTLF